MSESERERDARRKYEQRKAARDLKIPKCLNPERRAKAEESTRAWLATYNPDYYGGKLDLQIEALIADFDECVLFGGDQATAASRGIGKSTLVLWATISHQLRGNLDCALWLAGNGVKANQNMTNMKAVYTSSPLLLEDYPEVIIPILDVRSAPQRGISQTAGGQLTEIVWAADRISLPKIPGAKFSGATCSSLSIDSGSIRGFVDKNKRPQLVVLDDPETRESARSETECNNRRQTIEADIADMGTPERPVSRFILTTIQNRRCLSWEYTDRTKMPSFMGRRYQWITSWPKNSVDDVNGRLSLVEGSHWWKYVQLRREDMENGDRYGRRAHQYFVDHYDEMMEGAEATSERCSKRLLRDGSIFELNSVQRIFNVIAQRGPDGMQYVQSEWQNFPPPDDDAIQENSGINEDLIAKRLNTLEAGITEEKCSVIGCHIDVHKRWLQFTVIASTPDAVCSVIDYGVRPTDDPDKNGEDKAIETALNRLIDEIEETHYVDTLGRHKPLTVGLVDTGYKDSVVWKCLANRKRWKGCKGSGQDVYKHPARETQQRRTIGEHAYESLQANRQYLVLMDTEFWVRHTHEMFLAEPFNAMGVRNAGTLAVYGNDPNEHVRNDYARQLVAWIWTTKFERGKGMRTKLWPEHKDDHYLDTTYGALVACEYGKQVKKREAQRSQPTTAAEWFGG